MADDVWLEAVAAVSADADAELRLEAAEVFAAEAARTRLRDLTGLLRVRVRCGRVLVGQSSPSEPIDGHLVLAAAHDGMRSGATLVVPMRAVIVIDGAAVDLRDEAAPDRPRSLGSWLRERWLEGEALRILDRSGHTHVGPLGMVGADHVRLASGACVAIHAVDAWWC